METFMAIVISFPTVLWTGLLVFCLLYWSVALVGLADFDTPEIDPDFPDGGLEGIAGVMASLGLDGVPLSVALTAVALSGWTISYFSNLAVIGLDASGLARFIEAIVILIASVLLCLKPAS